MTAQVSTRRRRALCTVIATVVLATAASLSADTPSASAAGGHYYSHGSLWCDSTIGVGLGMTASVRHGESVRLRHTLIRWNGRKWVKVATAPRAQTLPMYAGSVSSGGDYWYTIGTFAVRSPELPAFAISEPGYYAITEAIRWLNSSGAVVDRHKARVASAGQNFCRF
jgi:hypothetical protein